MNPNLVASEAVGAEIRALMAKRGVSQAQLAAELRLSQPAVARRLSGVVPLDVNELAAVAAFLSVPAAELLQGQESSS